MLVVLAPTGRREGVGVMLCERMGSTAPRSPGRAETGSYRDRNSEREASTSAVRVRPGASHEKGSRTRTTSIFTS